MTLDCDKYVFYYVQFALRTFFSISRLSSNQEIFLAIRFNDPDMSRSQEQFECNHVYRVVKARNFGLGALENLRLRIFESSETFAVESHKLRELTRFQVPPDLHSTERGTKSFTLVVFSRLKFHISAPAIRSHHG